MKDTEKIQAHIDHFFNQQYRDAKNRIQQGSPVDDLQLALLAIRMALPKLDTDTSLEDWVKTAISNLTQARQAFRKKHEDNTGWGSATFVEMIDSLQRLLVPLK